MDELEEIMILLKKTLPKLVENPEIMEGCDVSQEEINQVKQDKKLSIEMLEHLAGDSFFETYSEEFSISEEEAREIGKFLFRSAVGFSNELKKEIGYLTD